MLSQIKSFKPLNSDNIAENIYKNTKNKLKDRTVNSNKANYM